MRISTLGLFSGSINAMIDQQSALAKTQTQVSTGKRVNTAADDPIAAVQILDLSRTQSESDQYGKNSNVARSRLGLEEQAMADSTTTMQRVRELIVEAGNSATMTDVDRGAIATELAQRLQELVAIANRKDGNGDYLFGGFSAQTQPFVTDTAGNVVYQGDQKVRNLQIGPGQTVTDGNSGFDVFMNVTQGNGTFVANAGAANTGGGSIAPGAVVDRAAWAAGAGPYTLQFDTPPTTYSITDSTSTVISTGTYTAGSAIQFNGVQVTISGTPAAGDTFGVQQSSSEDVFSSLNKLVAALRQPAQTDAGGAQLTTSINAGLQQLDQIGDHISDIRAQVGARLSILDDGDNARSSLNLDLQTSISGLRDVDYTQAVTQLNQQITGLQAAQLAYTKLSGLSLFSYMR